MECAVWPVQNPAIPVPVAGSLHARRTSLYLSPVPASETLQARVERALSQLKNPRRGGDVLAAGMVKDLAVDDRGTVSFTFLLGRDDPGSLAREVRKVVQGVPGVTAVRVNVTDASAAAGATAAGAPRTGPARVPPPSTPGELDYFLVDLPPGTGDAQLSLAQTVHIRGAVIVTTPQEVAVGDSLRGAKMFERVGVPVLGVVENMSFYVCPHCGERTAIFLAGGGTRLADELGVPLLGEVPLQAQLADLADTGRPIVAAQPDSPAARALDAIARRIADALAAVPR